MICGYRKLRDTNEVRCTYRLSRDRKFHFQSQNESGKWTCFLMTLCLYVTDKLRAYPQHKVLQRVNYFRREAIFLKFTDANLLDCRRIITILKLDNLCNKFLVSCLQRGISVIDRKGSNLQDTYLAQEVKLFFAIKGEI